MDAFERNLQAAQSELGLESNNTVQVIYKDEVELCVFHYNYTSLTKVSILIYNFSNTIMNILSFLLPIAFIIYIMRRGMGSMGGKKIKISLPEIIEKNFEFLI